MANPNIMNIAVIMAAYNGEKFIEEQIKSILNQKLEKDINISLFIRDDGSTDSTLNIIKRLGKLYSSISIIDVDRGNIGVKASFFNLLTYVRDYDLVFFSDQDDIWPNDKIDIFLGKLKELSVDKDVPLGIYSDAWISDENAKKTDCRMATMYGWKKDDASMEYLSFNYRVVGATFAINQAAVDLANKVPREWIPSLNMHDSFIALITSIYGKVVVIDQPLLFYRQHSNNLVGAGKKNKKISTKVKQTIKSIKSLVYDDYKLLEFMEMEGPRLLDNLTFARYKNFLNNYLVFRNSRSLIARFYAIKGIKNVIWSRHRFIVTALLYVLKF